MKAKDAMTSPAVAVPLGTSLREAAEIMLQKRIGSLLVVDGEGRVIGIVTESDFLKEKAIPFSTFRAPLLLGRFLGKDSVEKLLAEAHTVRVEEIMTSPVHTVTPETPLGEALRLMLDYDINHVPVVDGEGRPLGILTRFDLLRFLKDRL
ncbi:CBS domain-containing protein [Thermus sp.]|uniref:CBS domain-containing protein n=1 Tax=Thermus sp. TaxID=275 RepID=UPI00307CE1CA